MSFIFFLRRGDTLLHECSTRSGHMLIYAYIDQYIRNLLQMILRVTVDIGN